jgi:hypothetical protein
MRRRIGFLAILMMMAAASSAQRPIDENSPPAWKERVYFGGGLGLNGGTDGYGNRYFYYGLTPIIGYMVSQKFSVGTGITWQHYSYPDFNPKFTIDQYGVSPFLRYNLGQLFLYTEYNLINTPTSGNSERKNYDRLLLGLGYSQPLGSSRGALHVMGLYDVLYSQQERAFASPWVLRVFFSY